MDLSHEKQVNIVFLVQPIFIPGNKEWTHGRG